MNMNYAVICHRYSYVLYVFVHTSIKIHGLNSNILGPVKIQNQRFFDFRGRDRAKDTLIRTLYIEGRGGKSAEKGRGGRGSKS